MTMNVKKIVKKVLSIVLAVFMMLTVVFESFLPVTAWAETSDQETTYAAVYDYDYYKSHNEDLQKAFGENRQSYIEHFIKSGMKEGRKGNEEFILSIYKSNYEDLRTAYKDDNLSYYMHYIRRGKAEGRNAKTKIQQESQIIFDGVDYSPVYDYEYYRKNNADLQKVFGENSAKYLEHFVKSGMKESRQGNEEFNLAVYKSNYEDLRTAYKDDNVSYYMHYIRRGKAEGRNAKTKIEQEPQTVYNGVDYAAVYDYEYYQKNNADLQKVFGENSAKYLEHFVKSGMKESRQGNEEFNLAVYKSNYEDLHTAYKDDNVSYYMHYIRRGKAEGRNAKTKIEQKLQTVYNGVDYAAVYDYEYYRKNNVDLQKVFGENSAKYLEHFVKSGMKESRQGSEEFSLDVYKRNYADLSIAYKDDNVAYYMHYIRRGKAEGRNAKTLLQTRNPVAIFYANGGYFVKEDGSHTAIISQEPDAELGKITFNQVPKNDDLHLMFAGWYTNKECSGKQVGDYRLFIDKNVSFYAKWKECYSITFDANGGYFNGDENKTQFVSKAVKGTNFRYVDRYESIQRDSGDEAGWAWNHIGWTLDPEGKQTIDMDSLGEEVTSDMTVYAQWSYEERYAVTFDVGDGYFSDGLHTVVQWVWKKYANVSGWHPWIGEIPEIDDDTRMFDDWYTEKNGKGELLYSIDDFVLEGDTTIYANWKSAVMITYDANGGKIGSDNTYSFKREVGTSQSELYIDAERVGYTFNGWYFDQKCTKEVSYPLKLKENITLYAGWKKSDLAYHTVVLDANGGYFKAEYYLPESTTKEFVVTDIVYAYTPVSKDGLTVFDGWYLDKDCTKKAEYLDECQVKITEDVTLYAKWIPGYVVTFDGNGIDFAPNYYYESPYDGYVELSYYPRISIIVKPGEKINKAEIVLAGTIGYSIGGWYLDSECTQPVDFEEPITSDITYYASWHGDTEIIYDSNSEHEFKGGGLTLTEPALKGVEIVPDLRYTDDTGRYKVEGWYWDPECTQPVADSFVTDKAVHLYAKWKTVNIVTFDANGGGKFLGGKATKVYSVENGKTMVDYDYDKPEYWLTYLQKHIFKGWSTDPNGTDVISSDEIATYIINEDRVFYAIWELQYVVTFNANGGYFGDEDTITTTNLCISGSLLKDVGTPWISNGDEHKEFAGWYFEPECINKVNEDTYVVENDITLYAKWEERYCVITFDATGGFIGTEDTATLRYKCDKGDKLLNVFPLPPGNKDMHKEFGGWYLEPECINEAKITEYVIENDTIFYAKWDARYVVTFDGNGGFIDGNENLLQYQVVVEPGKMISYNPYAEIADDTKIFGGWYLEAECINYVEPYQYIPEGDVTLYAKWVSTYLVTFDGNGGFIYGVSDQSQYQVKIESGKNISQNPYVENSDNTKTFGGWYLEAECINCVEDPYEYIPEGNVTLYAKWVTAETQSFEETDAIMFETDGQETDAQEKESEQVTTDTIELETMVSEETSEQLAE